MVLPSPLSLIQKPIQFGTDGWRGIIAADFTFERVAQVAPIAAEILAQVYGDETGANRPIIVGYDQRFMAEAFAQATAETIQSAGFDVLLAQGYAPTPAFSWAVKGRNALGAIVLTASHNPAYYLGLKIKGAFGGSVPPGVTRQIETQLAPSSPAPDNRTPGQLTLFDPWPDYCQALQAQVDIPAIQQALHRGKLTLFADVMHGAAAGGLSRLLAAPLQELHGDRDPLFRGCAPEPLCSNIPDLLAAIPTYQRNHPETLTLGLVFDGDGDRLAAVDSQGNFLSSQVLIPILIEHLAARRGQQGEVVKTISGSDLIPKVAALYNLPVYETAIGYKYIADRMLTAPVLLGGEESGGIGYGHHIPERDALLSALYVLEAVVQSGTDPWDLYHQLQLKTDQVSMYDRIDLPLASMAARSQLIERLETSPPTTIADQGVVDCLAIDGYKFRLTDGGWLLIRFSGTEPVLRLYCEAATVEQVQATLQWAKGWASGES